MEAYFGATSDCKSNLIVALRWVVIIFYILFFHKVLFHYIAVKGPYSGILVIMMIICARDVIFFSIIDKIAIKGV